jgi:protein tyrosine/serine phosphatase
MKSMGVLQKEIELMDHIIAFNKAKGLDYDDYEMKKDMLDNEIQVYRKFILEITKQC